MAGQHQPPQEQNTQPGRESAMTPEPDFMPRHPGVGKLRGKIVLITGGDSGIGRATAIAMAREGATITFVYLDEHDDARETERLIDAESAPSMLIAGDVRDFDFCDHAVRQVAQKFGKIDILINNAAEQHEVSDPTNLDPKEVKKTFETNVFGYLYMIKAALPYMPEGGAIVNTTSVTAYLGHETLVSYSATKGAVVSLTRTLSQILVERGIRVNAVAPGPIWTPLIPASFDAEKVAKHGDSAPMKRAGQPNEVAPSFVFLASDDASYMTGQVLHPNGGILVGS